MKHLIASAILGSLSVLAVTATAQPHGDSEAHMERRVERMSERLGLDETQRAQLEDVLRDQAGKRRALREETRSRMSAILTEEQAAQMQAMRETRQARRAEHRQRHNMRGQKRHHRGRHHGGDCAKDTALGEPQAALNAPAAAVKL